MFFVELGIYSRKLIYRVYAVFDWVFAYFILGNTTFSL